MIEQPTVEKTHLYFALISSVFPTLATRKAYNLFHKPNSYQLRNSEKKLLDQARHFDISIDDDIVLKAFQWGKSGDPIILLVHGWSARAPMLAFYIRAMVKAGYQVISYDAIQHGESIGPVSDLANWAYCVNAVMAQIGTVDCILGHSLGAGAIVIASNLGLDTKKLVLIAPMSNAVKVTNQFGRSMGIPLKVMARMRDFTWCQGRTKLERFGVDWYDIFHSSFQVPTLIVHDEDDSLTPLENSYKLVKHWPWAELLETKGLGHQKILYNKPVLNQVLDFIRS